MHDEVTYNNLDECITESIYSIRRTLAGHSPRKKQKLDQTCPITFGKVRTRLGKPNPVTIKILFDSGASATIGQYEVLKHLRLRKETKTEWSTAAGSMNTDLRTKLQFKLMEFDQDSVIEWNIHVTKQKMSYDLIIGRDLMTELGIKIDFETNSVQWNDVVVPMKSVDATFATSYHVEDSDAIADATNRIQRILDAKYEPADFDEIIKDCTHLTEEEK